MKTIIFNADGTRTVLDRRTLEQAVNDAIARINAEYEAQIAAGATYAGKPVQIDPASTANMTAVISQITAGIPLPATFAWRMADNAAMPVASKQMMELAATASARVMALRLAMWAAKDVARAAKTNDDADAVKASWPKP